MKNVFCVIALMMFMFTACTSVAPAATLTLTPTIAPTETATSTSTPEPPTATATEAATTTPEIQISPDNESFMSYNISTDTIVNNTDDLVAKARQLDWGPDSTNPKYVVNFVWMIDGDGELIANPDTAPNFTDQNTRFIKLRMLGINTINNVVTSSVAGARVQLPGMDPKDYPIIILIHQNNISELKADADEALTDMYYPVLEWPVKRGDTPDKVNLSETLVEQNLKAHPEKYKVIYDAFSRLDMWNDSGKTDFSAFSLLNGAVIPEYVEPGKYIPGSGNDFYR